MLIQINVDIRAKVISEDCPEPLKFGNFYRVKEISMGQSYTYIQLYVSRSYFNSIHFEFYFKGKKIDIFRSPILNHYLSKDKLYNTMFYSEEEKEEN